MSKKFPFDLNKKILPHFNSYSTYDGVITSEQMSQFSGKDYNSLIRRCKCLTNIFVVKNNL